MGWQFMKRDWGPAIWVTAAVCLGLNDFYLKGSGLLPSAITGKLSDLAGLIVAPVCLYGALRWVFPTRQQAFRRRLLLFCLGAVGLTFAAINLSKGASDLVVGLFALIGLSWSLWPDPSDLVALLILPLTYFVLNRDAQFEACERDGRVRAVVVLVSAVLCLGSGVDPTDTAHGFVINNTSESLNIRTAFLAGEMDCRSGPLIEDGLLVEKDFTPLGSSKIEPNGARRFYSDAYQHTSSSFDVSSSQCRPLRVAVWREGQDEAEALSLVIGFSRERRELRVPHLPEDLEDTQGLALLYLEEGELKIELGKGLRRVELGDGKRAPVPSHCVYPELTSMSGSAEVFTIAEIEERPPRCMAYRATASEEEAVGMGGGPGDPSAAGGGSVGGEGGSAFSGLASPGPSVLVCTNVELDLRLGDSVNLSAGHDAGYWPGLRFDRDHRWLLYTHADLQAHEETDCPQIRGQCGAILVRTPAAQIVEDGVLEAAWTTILARSDCPREVREPVSIAHWVVK